MNRLWIALCSLFLLPSHAGQTPTPAFDVDSPIVQEAVRMESVVVVPAPEDKPMPAKDRWQRFEETLNAGAPRRYRRAESATNDGVRMSCREPTILDSCVTSGGFTTVGHGFGR